MDVMTAGTADNLFAASLNQTEAMDTLANQALASGIDKYMAKDYKGAAQDFSRAFGLSPYSDFAYDATKYTAMAYQAMGEPQKAIKAYAKAASVNPTDDRLQLEMGNILFAEGRYGEAISKYETAVRLYDDSTNRFSLAQGYMKAGRYQEAENQFSKIIDMGGEAARNGHFGLGQVYREQEKYTDAIDQFERAIAMDDEFFEAYAEIGYALTDAGRAEEAETLRDELESKDETLAFLLDSYIGEKSRPRIMFAYADSTFKYFMSPKSPLAAMDEYLANADAEKTLMLKFQFDKEMDRESVENIFNWEISRSEETGPGSRYNNGLAVPSTEITLPQFPVNVYYDEKNLTATVYFSVRQNAQADGTIDPSHTVFSFSGQDAYGNEMDAEYDQFMGFSKSF
jgi:tetratricopeptide (TPR) repeat protein